MKLRTLLHLSFVICALSLVTACTPDKRRVDPPSLGGITSAVRVAGDLNAQAKAVAKEIHDKGTPAKSAPSKQLIGLQLQIDQAHAAALAETQRLQGEVNGQAELVAAAQHQADIWKGKQRKALKELWFWRGLVILALLWIFRKQIAGGIGFVARKFIGVPWCLIIGLGILTHSPPLAPLRPAERACASALNLSGFGLDPDDTGEGERPC
jgi:hypothetical protein